MGSLYPSIVRRVNRQLAAEYLEAYRALVEAHKNFLEVFNEDGSVYQTPFYYCDEGMLWAANLLVELRRA